MKTYILCALLYFGFLHPVYSNMLVGENMERLKVFSSITDTEGLLAVLKGKVLSYSSKEELEEVDLFGSAQDKCKATVRLYNTDGINEGDTLYVIDNKNLIVAKIKVKTIFNSTTFGSMLIGYGNFRLSSAGDRVVQKADVENSKYSYIYKARGDYYDNIGEQGDAIREYREALKLDKNNPNAHLALGLIYMKQGIVQYAFKEFAESYKYIHRIYDNDDKYELLQSMATIRFKEVYETFIPAKLKNKYREEGIRYCKEALSLYPESEKMNYYLGIFHYKTANPDDKTARDYFLRVIELNHTSVDALVALSELYYYHENMTKARMYAEKALVADNRSERARKLLKNIESKEQVK